MLEIQIQLVMRTASYRSSLHRALWSPH